MTEIAPDAFRVEMQLRVAAVGGTFEGEIALQTRRRPGRCSINVSGAGTFGHGNGERDVRDLPRKRTADSRLDLSGAGEIGGLVAGVGQRILSSVSKHWSDRFFTSLRNSSTGRGADGRCGMRQRSRVRQYRPVPKRVVRTHRTHE